MNFLCSHPLHDAFGTCERARRFHEFTTITGGTKGEKGARAILTRCEAGHFTVCSRKEWALHLATRATIGLWEGLGRAWSPGLVARLVWVLIGWAFVWQTLDKLDTMGIGYGIGFHRGHLSGRMEAEGELYPELNESGFEAQRLENENQTLRAMLPKRRRR